MAHISFKSKPNRLFTLPCALNLYFEQFFQSRHDLNCDSHKRSREILKFQIRLMFLRGVKAWSFQSIAQKLALSLKVVVHGYPQLCDEFHRTSLHNFEFFIRSLVIPPTYTIKLAIIKLPYSVLAFNPWRPEEFSPCLLNIYLLVSP